MIRLKRRSKYIFFNHFIIPRRIRLRRHAISQSWYSDEMRVVIGFQIAKNQNVIRNGWKIATLCFDQMPERSFADQKFRSLRNVRMQSCRQIRHIFYGYLKIYMQMMYVYNDNRHTRILWDWNKTHMWDKNRIKMIFEYRLLHSAARMRVDRCGCDAW